MNFPSPVFDTNFLGYQPTGPTAFIFMFISKIMSVIRADFNVISQNLSVLMKNHRPLADGPTLISNTASLMYLQRNELIEILPGA